MSPVEVLARVVALAGGALLFRDVSGFKWGEDARSVDRVLVRRPRDSATTPRPKTATTLLRRRADPRWGRLLYLLMLVPLITDLAETGAWPDSPRALITEVVLAIVIWGLARRVCRDMQSMARMARVDALTGLLNRRAFHEALEDECARARRCAGGLTLVYLDLDNFKRVNDERGHDAGDKLLQHVAAVLRESVRAHVDRCFRLGGDEFAVLLPLATAEDARQVVGRLRERMHRPYSWGRLAGVGVSCGIVERGTDEDPESLVHRADREMYRQKAGRRRR